MRKGRNPGRLRFAGLAKQDLADGSRRVRVDLEWLGRVHTGEAEGTGSLEGDLRAAGEATASAASAATGGRVTLSLIGIKAIRAFDGRVVIASVEARTSTGALKLLSAQALDETEVHEGGVRTVLGAVNRMITPYLEEEGEAR